jgi:hypothetical protein
MTNPAAGTSPRSARGLIGITPVESCVMSGD